MQPGFSSCLGGSSSLSRSEKMDQLDEMMSFHGRTDFLNDTHVNILEVSPRSFLTNLTGSYLNIVTPRLVEKMRCVHSSMQNLEVFQTIMSKKKSPLPRSPIFRFHMKPSINIQFSLMACCESLTVLSTGPRFFCPRRRFSWSRGGTSHPKKNTHLEHLRS